MSLEETILNLLNQKVDKTTTINSKPLVTNIELNKIDINFNKEKDDNIIQTTEREHKKDTKNLSNQKITEVSYVKLNNLIVGKLLCLFLFY